MGQAARADPGAGEEEGETGVDPDGGFREVRMVPASGEEEGGEAGVDPRSGQGVRTDGCEGGGWAGPGSGQWRGGRSLSRIWGSGFGSLVRRGNPRRQGRIQGPEGEEAMELRVDPGSGQGRGAQGGRGGPWSDQKDIAPPRGAKKEPEFGQGWPREVGVDPGSNQGICVESRNYFVGGRTHCEMLYSLLVARMEGLLVYFIPRNTSLRCCVVVFRLCVKRPSGMSKWVLLVLCTPCHGQRDLYTCVQITARSKDRGRVSLVPPWGP